ncbi:MAG TPA: ATP-binding protein [Gemmatimonadaceae bacterium]|nr:ATP-binding protein [Gemmatimonadaceae bacterium]
MSSIRGRLTTGYAAALAGTILAFALVLYAARRASSYEELQRYVTAEANIVLSIIRQAELEGRSLIQERDPLVGPVVTPTVAQLLDGVPDYVVVFGRDGVIIYRSPAVRQLLDAGYSQLINVGASAPLTGPGQLATLQNDQVLVVARAPADPNSAIARVVVAASTQAANLAIAELFGTMLIIAPILLLASVGIAYAISSRAFRQVDRMINEVQAITDGRSLHRRLPVESSGDELARLAVTLNEMMERLETSFGGLRRFTADASHELKTPLAVLRADVERAMSPTTSRTEKLVALEEALQETTRMADLVASLLTLARADEGRFDLHREPVELEPLVREVSETAHILGEESGLDVALPVVMPATVMGDRTRLRQLFLNLVTNAIKYTPRGGSVEVSLSTAGKTATFSVRDTGIGISAADLPHVFERFYRADRARSRTAERGGFGLGLAISHWIAEAHGGTISVRSRLGRGSTFTVTLPMVEEGVAAAGEGAALEEASS